MCGAWHGIRCIIVLQNISIQIARVRVRVYTSRRHKNQRRAKNLKFTTHYPICVCLRKLNK